MATNLLWPYFYFLN